MDRLICPALPRAMQGPAGTAPFIEPPLAACAMARSIIGSTDRLRDRPVTMAKMRKNA
jgi:hypothetical protein